MGVRTSEDVFEYYRYSPSIAAAVVFILLFAATSVLHAYQLVRTRTWSFLPVVVGGFSEVFGYIARIFSAKQSPNYSIGLFVTQASATLLAPALFAASIYMCLGRIIRLMGCEHLSLIPLTRLTIFFVAGDVLGLLVQGIGAIIMPLGTLQDYHIGSNIVIAGLALLTTYFGLFMTVMIVFDFRIRREPTRQYLQSASKWKADLRTLYFSSVLIFIRSIFRLIEYSQGNDGWLIRREWTLYVFDATLMLCVFVPFNIWHPSHVEAFLHGGKYSEMLGMRITEVKMEKS